jgi:hypothetical protein
VRDAAQSGAAASVEQQAALPPTSESEAEDIKPKKPKKTIIVEAEDNFEEFSPDDL